MPATTDQHWSTSAVSESLRSSLTAGSGVPLRAFQAFLFPEQSQAFQAFLMARGPSAHHRAPLTHASHHRPTLVHLSRFRVSPILTHSRFWRSSTCVSAVSGVSFSRAVSGVSGVFYGPRPYHSEFSSPEVEQGPIGKLSSRRTRSCNNLRFHKI
jgi:hypothetical protein